jgi:hypothetical protein
MDPVDELVASMEAEAAGRAGHGDFGAGNYRGALRAWAQDLLGPQLNEIGQAFMRRLAVSALVRRLRVLACLREHPEIAEVALPRVILISGLPRTGTTLAHNLFALCASTRPLLRWEIMDPVPPPEAASYAGDARIAKVQRSIDPLRGSLLERMHWVNADEPEECAWGYLDCTSMMGRGCAAAMPVWRRYVMDGDARATFREYRSLLQLLLWHNPVPEGGVLVLKCPQISGVLASFAQELPEASFVLTHRDPYRALLSSSTFLHTLSEAFLKDPPQLRREQDPWLARNQADNLSNMVAFAETMPGARIAHLHYPDLLDDGPLACRRALGALDVTVDPGFAARAAAFLDRQRNGARAEPPTTYDDFGYDHDAVLNEPAVAEYCRHFSLQPERTRRTG